MAKTLKDRKKSAILLKDALLPLGVDDVAEQIKSLGVRAAVLFGGALMDARFGRKPRDFDVIVQVNPDGDFFCRLSAASESLHVASANRYVAHLESGLKLDIVTTAKLPTAQRVLRGTNVGVSSVAMDLFSRQVWASPEYERDHASGIIQPRDGVPRAKCADYMQKLATKLPKYRLA